MSTDSVITCKRYDELKMSPNDFTPGSVLWQGILQQGIHTKSFVSLPYPLNRVFPSWSANDQ